MQETDTFPGDNGQDQAGAQPNPHKSIRSFSSIKEATTAYRNFNMACLVFYIFTACFMGIFLTYLDGLLIAVFVVQFLFAFANLVYHCLNPMRQENYIRLRLQLVYIPYGILNLIFLYDFYRFFRQLEDYNDQFSGGPTIPVQGQQITEAFVTIWLIHFIIAPFFQGLSMCVMASEVGKYLK